MMPDNNILPWCTPLRVVLICMLAWALVPINPYGYYILIRWVACAVFVYLAISAHRNSESGWVLLFVLSAGLYNPIIRVHLGRPIWLIVNIISICLLSASFLRKRLP